ncbi:hypothetical protein HGM15179_010612 [Zosterops borbonicus]|uniref:Uncharacterized protein n=1 Tax=Zosterops borbonicus TaxID=364589 RepID=A0A8K1GE10_9PASS|nr:hypothetical protein HGM15179_010612 [Zosterops borbonicus]
MQHHYCENVQLPFDPEIVQELLLQLDPCRSMGHHEIQPRILKELADVMAKLLLMIFVWFWESREIPAEGKVSDIVLIFKKGKKGNPGNYRPASLTSVPGSYGENYFGR